MVFQLCFSSHYACVIIIILMDLVWNYNIEMEFRKATFAKRSDRYPRNDRTQGERGSRSGGSRYGGSSSGGSRYGGSSSGGSRYGGSSSGGSRYGGSSSGGSRYGGSSSGGSRYGGSS